MRELFVVRSRLARSAKETTAELGLRITPAARVLLATIRTRGALNVVREGRADDETSLAEAERHLGDLPIEAAGTRRCVCADSHGTGLMQGRITARSLWRALRKTKSGPLHERRCVGAKDGIGQDNRYSHRQSVHICPRNLEAGHHPRDRYRGDHDCSRQGSQGSRARRARSAFRTSYS